MDSDPFDLGGEGAIDRRVRALDLMWMLPDGLKLRSSRMSALKVAFRFDRARASQRTQREAYRSWGAGGPGETRYERAWRE
jgi:hypothetical protein